MENTPTFEVVERPNEDAQRDEFVAAFLATLETGKAIKVSLNGVAYRTFGTRLQTLARTHKVQQRIRRAGPDHVIIWAEKRVGSGETV